MDINNLQLAVGPGGKIIQMPKIQKPKGCSEMPVGFAVPVLTCAKGKSHRSFKAFMDSHREQEAISSKALHN